MRFHLDLILSQADSYLNCPMNKSNKPYSLTSSQILNLVPTEVISEISIEGKTSSQNKCNSPPNYVKELK